MLVIWNFIGLSRSKRAAPRASGAQVRSRRAPAAGCIRNGTVVELLARLPARTACVRVGAMVTSFCNLTRRRALTAPRPSGRGSVWIGVLASVFALLLVNGAAAQQSAPPVAAEPPIMAVEPPPVVSAPPPLMAPA